MTPLHLLLLLVLPLSTTTTQTRIECVLPSHPQTRTFPSLLDYQHNTQSFRVNGAGYSGNSVNFNFNTINRIPKNAFITFTSQYVWQITLRDKRIEQIDDGAFVNLDCLHVLDLGNNSLSVLREGMFEKLGNLVTLQLDGNLLGELGNLVFRELGSLRHLDLGRNRIERIGVEAFENLNKLQSLNLGYNLLTNIHPATFSPLGNLISLQLNANRIHNLAPQLWNNLTKLTDLNVAENSLTSFDPGYNFSFASLATLNLSMNELTKLNVHALRKHLPALGTIDLNGNPWLCEDLATIIPALRDARIAYVKTRSQVVRNEDGIPCNYNSVTYTEKTTTEGSVATKKPTDSVSNVTNNMELHVVDNLRNATLEVRQALEKSNLEVLNSMEKTRNLIVSLIVLVVIFIALELTFRTGLVNRVIRRRGDPYLLNDHNVDNIALLST